MEFCNQGHPAYDPSRGCGPCADERDAGLGDRPDADPKIEVQYIIVDKPEPEPVEVQYIIVGEPEEKPERETIEVEVRIVDATAPKPKGPKLMSLAEQRKFLAKLRKKRESE